MCVSITDPSLTTTKLTKILQQVHLNLRFVCWNLGIPDSTYYELKPQGVQALADYYITNVKSASWHQVAIALYKWEQHDSLEMLREEVPSIKRESYSYNNMCIVCIMLLCVYLINVCIQTDMYMLYMSTA